MPAEPHPRTWNVDPARVETLVTHRTRAIVAVDLYGQPADFAPLADVASRHRLLLVEDAAQAHGARYHGRRAGSLADAGCFSFYPGKNLGAAGDAGAIVTDDPELAERARMIRNYGSRAKYHHELQGLNSRLDSVQAAVLRAKLPLLDDWNARRREVAAEYLSLLGGLPELTLPSAPAWAEPVWHLFVVQHARRDALREALAARGVETLIHYPIACHRAPAYRHLGLPPGSLPETERLADRVLSLPMGPHLTDEDVAYVAACVRDAVGRPAD